MDDLEFQIGRGRLARMIRYFCIAAFIVVMIAWRYFVVAAIDNGGHWAFIAIMAGIFAFAFWWEKRFPTQRER